MAICSILTGTVQRDNSCATDRRQAADLSAPESFGGRLWGKLSEQLFFLAAINVRTPSSAERQHRIYTDAAMLPRLHAFARRGHSGRHYAGAPFAATVSPTSQSSGC